MPKKTKKQKILASYRRKIKLLESQSFEKTVPNDKKKYPDKLNIEKNNAKPSVETSQDQIIKKFFIKDFFRSFILTILIIGIIIGLYLIKII